MKKVRKVLKEFQTKFLISPFPIFSLIDYSADREVILKVTLTLLGKYKIKVQLVHPSGLEILTVP